MRIQGHDKGYQHAIDSEDYYGQGGSELLQQDACEGDANRQRAANDQAGDAQRTALHRIWCEGRPIIEIHHRHDPSPDQVQHEDDGQDSEVRCKASKAPGQLACRRWPPAPSSQAL